MQVTFVHTVVRRMLLASKPLILDHSDTDRPLSRQVLFPSHSQFVRPCYDLSMEFELCFDQTFSISFSPFSGPLSPSLLRSPGHLGWSSLAARGQKPLVVLARHQDFCVSLPRARHKAFMYQTLAVIIDVPVHFAHVHIRVWVVLTRYQGFLKQHV